jgi:hypothetical protein
MRGLALSVVLCFVFSTACARKEPAAASGQPQATVVLRDGTTVTGTVVESSASEIKLIGDNNATQTIAMNKVKSIDYGETQAAPQGDTSASPGREREPRAARNEPEPRHEPHHRPAQSQITTRTYEVPAGTQISVRIEEPIDSGKAVEGQTFAAEVTKDVADAAGGVVIPRGANAQVVIKSASKGGRFRGSSDLVLDLKAVSVEGRMYEVQAADISEKGRSGVGVNKRTAEYSGGGAALGAIIGAIAGGGKGAAIGAGSGAGAGALTEILTKGGAVRVPAETVLRFQLDKPLRVVEAR